MAEPKRTSFEIYHKKEGFHWSDSRIIYSIMLPSMLILFIENVFFDLGEKKNIFDSILLCLIFGSVAYGVIIKLIGSIRHKPLKGKLEGLLILEIDKISIGNQVYNLDDIRTIKILNYDYYRRLENGRNFKPYFSQGVDNKIYITLNSGEIISCAFYQYNQYDMAKAKKQLINYHLKGKIHFLHLIDILDITDYNQTQLFKKEIQWFQEDELKS